MSLPVLAYNGQSIKFRGKLVCLTDMWRHAGRPSNKEPFNWARFEGREFIEFMARRLNLSIAQVFFSERGRTGGAWGHWQVALTYAPYLAPGWQEWANTVLKAHMEGTELPELPVLRQSSTDQMLERVLMHCVQGVNVAQAALVGVNEVKQEVGEVREIATRALTLATVNTNPLPESVRQNRELYDRTREKARNTKYKHEKRYGVSLDWDISVLQEGLIARFHAGRDRWGIRITSVDDIELDQMNPNGGYDYWSNYEWVHRTSNRSKQDKTLEEYSLSLRKKQGSLI